MTRAQVAGLATEGPQVYETKREASAWWTGCLWGLLIGLSLGAIGTAYLLCRVVETASAVAS